MTFADRLLYEIDRKKNPSIVGLDTELHKIPETLRNKFELMHGDPFERAANCMLEFNKAIISAIKDIVPAIKVQVAFYEQYGHHGFRAFQETVRWGKEHGLLVIEDGKRNDIGNTARAYADAHLGEISVFGTKMPSIDVDCITVNAYLGSDGVLPFIDNVKRYGKGIFVLVKTSNPSSGELQDLFVGKKRVYEVMADLVHTWGKDAIGARGYSSVGAVVGATYPKEAVVLRAIMPNAIFLVPGYGAQGGGAEDVMPAFNKDGYGALIHSARAVIYAGSEQDFAEKAKDAAISMREDIIAAMKDASICPWPG
jgi:orotidine-5'-phosphate decarboxylase